MRLTGFFALSGILLAALGLSGCFEDKETLAERYAEWRQKNEKYILDQEARVDAQGNAYFTRLTPSWAPDTYVLAHWHNDRRLTQNNLSPMDNSTVQVTYQLLNVDGEEISNSFSSADSVYTSRPSQNIIGMWVAMTSMNVGDSVTLVIPASAGYGERTYGQIPPYSTLVYGVKLKAIKAYEVP
ncbi:MAG: FKBP-type peptidyl-prolyl cis-trans isomerase [Muribaculaceae bacterium]|nr:FKBP-type peptidyl-prolyl cis-trans isomerase [Muribaculaceae bacterium]